MPYVCVLKIFSSNLTRFSKFTVCVVIVLEMYVCMYMCFVSEVLAMGCGRDHMVVEQREEEGDHDDIVIITYQ